MFAWQATVQDEAGNAVPLPVVTVYIEDGVTLASIYTESGIALPNPLTGTLEGFVQFWADIGLYKIEGASGGDSTEVWSVELGVSRNFFDTRAELVAYVASNPNLKNGTELRADGLSYVWQAGDTAIPDMQNVVPMGVIHLSHFGAIRGTVSEEQALLNTALIQAAYDYSAASGQEIFVGAGPWVVHLREADRSSAPATYRQGALVFGRDNVSMSGLTGLSRIRSFSDQGTYSVVQWFRAPLTNGIPKFQGGGASDIVFDNNCADTTVFAGRQAVIGMAGCRDFTFERCEFANSGHYGVGMQNGAYINVKVIDCIFDNTGKDAIDIKNNVNGADVSSVFGVHIIRPVIRRACRAADPTASAAIDVMGWGVIVDSPFFDGVPTDAGANYSSLVRFKEGLEPFNGRGWGAQAGRVTNLTVKFYGGAEKPPGAALIECRAPYVMIDNPVTYGTPPAGTVGVLLSQAYSKVTGGRLLGMETGVWVRARITDGTWNAFEGAEDSAIEGVTFEGCAVGVHANRRRTRVMGCDFPNSTVGVKADASDAQNLSILFNNFHMCATPYQLNFASGHVIDGNTAAPGFVALSQAESGEMRHAVLSALASIRLSVGYDGDPANVREVLRLSSGATTVAETANNLQIQASGAGGPVHIVAAGSDANVDLRLSPKGNGRMRFGPYTAQADAPVTGYIEIKDTNGTLRRLAVIG